VEYFSAKYNGQELDPELFLVETDDNEEFDTESTVVNLLKVAAGIKGHLMRPEVWGIVCCGLNVAKPKWCEEKEYIEIQKT
ncbi:1606_t:CDS:2, partial [Entrophospora sp. SA101]